MGLLDRLRGARGSLVSAQVEPLAAPVSLLGGQDDLEVVGELAYQAALWRLCGGTVGERVRRDIVAVLVPEPANPYDANAVAVQIDGQVAGYLSRATAQEYLPGLKHAMSLRGGYIALRGVIVGGGYYDDGPGRLGVWLEHDPADFGVHPASFSRPAPPGHSSAGGVMQTGPRSRNSASCSPLNPTRLTGTSSSPSWRRGSTDRVTCMSQLRPSTTRHAPVTTRRWRASARPLWPSGERSRCWTRTGRWLSVSRRRRTGRPANGGPNAVWLSTDSAPHGKRLSRTSLSVVIGP